jgi:hypothetical protein
MAARKRGQTAVDGRELSLEGDEQHRLGDVERLIWMVNRAKKLN